MQRRDSLIRSRRGGPDDPGADRGLSVGTWLLLFTVAAGVVLSGCGGNSTGTVPAGTILQAELGRRLSIEDVSKGDSFTATVSTPVTSGTTVLVPEGATVHGEVTAVQEARGREQPALLKVAFRSLRVRGTEVPIAASLDEVHLRTRTETRDEGAKIGGGAAAGALLGAVLGGDAEGAIAGAAVGAAAGTAVTLGTADQRAYLPEGSQITIRLEEAATVPVE